MPGSPAASELGPIFAMQPTAILPADPPWLASAAFPAAVHVGRARDSRATGRLALLVHGFAMNEDYFGLLAPELVGRGYDVWALRLPGYAASGERLPWLTPPYHGISIGFYGWVVASTLAHLQRTLGPQTTLTWGHSLGAAALTIALCAYRNGDGSAIADRVVLEAPAFSQALALSGGWMTLFTVFPATLLNLLGGAMFVDDIRSSEFARRQCIPFVPGRSNRLLLTLNALALANPLSGTSRPAPDVLARCWFLIGEFDRLIDYDRLVRLLDDWHVAPERRLALQRNHFLSLTCPAAIVRWLEDGYRPKPHR